MATHDYVLANASGASFRADLNNALAAIVSNNSNATAPATTYAYQWWADTTANQLKLRNSTNDDWIVIQELDGTMLIADGTAAAPGLAFADDTDTGLFSSSSNRLNITTGGVERAHISSSGFVINEGGVDTDFRVEGDDEAHLLFVDAGTNRVGIGTSSPSGPLHIQNNDDSPGGAIQVWGADTGANLRNVSLLAPETDSSTAPFTFYTNNSWNFRVDSTDALTIDASANVGIGTASPSQGLEVAGAIVATGAASTYSSSGLYIQNKGSSVFDVGAWRSGASAAEMSFSTDSGSDTAPVERMRINSSGNVGIGTTSPDEKLHVVGDQRFEGQLALFPISTGGEGGEISLKNPDKSTTGATIDVSATNTFRIFQLNNNSVMDLGQFGGTGGVIKFRTEGSERLRIMNDGDIRFKQFSTSTPGFGNTTTGLGVEDLSSGAALYVSRSDAGPFMVNRNTNGTVVDLRRSGSQKGNIQVTTTTATFNSASDYRLKENVVALSDGITRLKQLSPSRFNFIEEPDITVDGFIAHEVQAVVPEAVTGTHDEVDDDDNPVMQGMDYGKLTPLLTAALQEAIAKIETLEAKVAALEAA